MTIAAGFRFDTGILLCADTHHTSQSRTEETKIYVIGHHMAKVALAITGRVMYAKRAVEHITQNIKSIPQDQLSKGRLQNAIEDGLQSIFNNHVYTHPDWGKEASPEFSFVIAMYSPIDGAVLLQTEETLSAEIADHICLGSGNYLGDYLARMYKGKDQSLSSVVLLAIYILQQAKSYDAHCGGKSEFIILWKAGNTSPVGELDISAGEIYAQHFQDYTSPLFYAMGDTEQSDDNAKEMLEEAVKALMRARRVLKDGKDKIDKLKVALMQKKENNETTP